MKRLIVLITAIVAIAIMLSSMVSCDEIKEGASTLIEESEDNSEYDYAIIEMLDGTKLQIELESIERTNIYYFPYVSTLEYIDYAFYIYGKDGIGYMVSRNNCVLINDPNVEINVTINSGGWAQTVSEAYVRLTSSEIITIDGADVVTANLEMVKDKNGMVYTAAPDDIIVKFTYTKG